MGKSFRVLIAVCLLSSVGPLYAQETASNKQPALVEPPTASKPSADDPNYKIGAQDVVDISVWKEPDFTRTVPVRPDGKISLPLLNDIQASGLTPAELAAEVTKSLTKYVTNPQVTVIVSQINSQRVYLLGEVVRPGTYTMLPDMTVLQALANAGSFSQYANPKKIYVLRQENGKPRKFFFNYKDVISGKHIEQNITLKPGDTIVVP